MERLCEPTKRSRDGKLSLEIARQGPNLDGASLKTTRSIVLGMGPPVRERGTQVFDDVRFELQWRSVSDRRTARDLGCVETLFTC